VASLAYRVFIVVAIILLVADRFFIIGGLIAVWAAVTQGVTPIAKSLASVFRSPRLQRQRRRAIATTAALVAAGLVLLFLIPLPSWTRAEGVVWLPAQSRVRAGADGFLVRLLAPEGSRVRRGTPLVESEDPLLETQVRLLSARVSGLEAQLRAQEPENRAMADATKRELASLRAQLARARERLDSLVIHSPGDGVFVVPEARDLPGRFVQRGETLGYVANRSQSVLRVVVGQDDIGLVRERTRDVEVALATWDAKPVPARIVRAVPAASEQLPTRALGGSGGGTLPVDPRDPTGLRTMEKVFEYDLALPDEGWGRFIGQRVYVRFDHGYEALGRQLYRAGRQLFLSRFGI
jgi:putative peptide zinc metalloprotease protein